ncbi:MAG: hypothetical protein ABIC91_04725 [Nanoarchaeota archaeon]|nr:hypothetical protein [Nanoarchaeota archaeon]MBU1030679.1 hypothetical protein [Nanoarchaeota archaeon]MBU1849338.1 hypothetical protein [Nanoarchaeota archaeon]
MKDETTVEKEKNEEELEQEQNLEQKLREKEDIRRIQRVVDRTKSKTGEKIFQKNAVTNAKEYILEKKEEAKEKKSEEDTIKLFDYQKEAKNIQQMINSLFVKDLSTKYQTKDKILLKLFELISETVKEKYQTKLEKRIIEETRKEKLYEMQDMITNLKKKEHFAQKDYDLLETKIETTRNELFNNEAIMKTYNKSIEDGLKEINKLRDDQQKCYNEKDYETAGKISKELSNLKIDVNDWRKKRTEAASKIENKFKQVKRYENSKIQAYTKADFIQTVLISLESNFENIDSFYEQHKTWSGMEGIIDAVILVKQTNKTQKKLDEITEYEIKASKNLPREMDFSVPISQSLQTLTTSIENDCLVDGEEKYTDALKLANNIREELYS